MHYYISFFGRPDREECISERMKIHVPVRVIFRYVYVEKSQKEG